jgi:uncharacterized hydrophobic protein (TIGR00271 family)
MMHVRVVSPPALTGDLAGWLGSESAVANVVVHPGAAQRPGGDAVQFDVEQAGANVVFARLRGMGLDGAGPICVEQVDAALVGRGTSRSGSGPLRREREPVWEMVEATIRAGEEYAPSFYILLTIAGLIGAVGILTNSQILVVGAMVVGPEYGAMIGVALGIDKRDAAPIRRGLNALLFGFALAIAVTLLFSLVIRAFDLQPRAFEIGIRPVSDLIDTPNAFSVIVAVLAGIVGVVSLTEARASTLIGVFISVTTIPAAADTGLSLAFEDWGEARGAFLQLLVNVVILIGVGAIGLAVLRRIWGQTGWRTGARRS